MMEGNGWVVVGSGGEWLSVGGCWWVLVGVGGCWWVSPAAIEDTYTAWRDAGSMGGSAAPVTGLGFG